MQVCSQDNLAAVVGSTTPPVDMYIPPPITPLGEKAGIGVTLKNTPVVLMKETEKTQMEVDGQTSSTAPGRPPMPAPRTVRTRGL